MTIRTIAILVLFTPVLVFAQRSSYVEESCAGASGHADRLHCFESWATVSQTSLAREEQATRNLLAKADEEPEDIARALSAFEQAQRNYLTYRQTQCDYVASLAFGGNGASDRRLLCQIELDRRRTANLKSARLSISKTVTGPPSGDSPKGAKAPPKSNE